MPFCDVTYKSPGTVPCAGNFSVRNLLDRIQQDIFSLGRDFRECVNLFFSSIIGLVIGCLVAQH